MHKRVALLVLAGAVVSLAATSPESREITDPKKIASAEVSGAGAVPIDDLFYTRNTGGGAWSPDGKEIVFTSNFTGRFNCDYNLHERGCRRYCCIIRGPKRFHRHWPIRRCCAAGRNHAAARDRQVGANPEAGAAKRADPAAGQDQVCTHSELD